ncbi:MAG: hypothetical protein AB1640_11765 [bacterium]
MTQLRITLQQPLAQGRLEAGAIATVRLLADADGKIAKDWWSQEKPVAVVGGEVRCGAPAVFDLPRGGYYGVEITRPRGADISRELLVQDGEVRAEMITMDASPHEYLGWQQYAGIVRSDRYPKEAARRAIAPLSTGSERLGALMMKSREKIDALYGLTKGIPDVFAASVPAAINAWDQVADATRGGARDWATAGGFMDWRPQGDDEYATWFRETPDPHEGIELIRRLKEQDPPANVLAAKFPRWISFVTGGQIDLASVPWPWWGAQRHEDERIRFLYDRVRPSPVDREVPGRLTLSVHDPRWFGLLEFLASGRLSRTGDMFKSVLQGEDPEGLFDPEIALYGKVKGPLVATAGAIILIAQAVSTERQHWDRWVENLSRWFPGIPDGPILLGCRRVAQAQSLDDLTQAFKHLREGIDRGIPFFSASIRMLTLTLAQIGSDVPEAEDARRFVAPVSTRVDPDQPFTAVRL